MDAPVNQFSVHGVHKKIILLNNYNKHLDKTQRSIKQFILKYVWILISEKLR